MLGRKVKISVPENARLHGAAGVVVSIEAWGYVVATKAAATGLFRAAVHEVYVESTGDVCSECGSANMVRSGTCMTCMNCGTTSGCS